MRRILLLILALAVLVSCGGPPEGTDLSGCEIVAGPDAHGDTITVALLEPVNPDNAPAAGNASERLVFRHIYETLITLDCTGGVHPGLASKWRRKDGGRMWVFTLREGAEFHDGSPVEANDVRESWRRAVRRFPSAHATVDSVGVAGPRELHVFLSQRRNDVPRMLAGSEFAVAKPTGEWPLGSGPYEIQPERTYGVHVAAPAAGTRGPVLEFIESGHDARDLLAGTIDMMITADPDVIEYADGQGALETVALPWNDTYVLLSTYRVSRVLLSGPYPVDVPRTFFEDLARDAVRSDARAHETSVWWNTVEDCPELTGWVTRPPREAQRGTPRILYPADDPVARDIAERLMALEAPGTWVIPGVLAGGQAHGADPEEFAARLVAGDLAAYVLPLPRNPSDPCYAAAELIGRARWLARLGTNFRYAPVPLVDTRRHVIVRSGRVGLAMDFFGNVMPTSAMGGR